MLVEFKKRLLIIYSVIIGFIGLLVIRLFAICVINHDNLKAKADAQNSVTVDVSENRGNIYDRNMLSFTHIEPVSVCAIFSLNDAKKDMEICEIVSKHTNKTAEELFNKLNKEKVVSVELNFDYNRRITKYHNVRVAEVSKRYLKDYPLSNVIGYVSNGVGVSGIEKLYDKYLTNTKTARYTAKIDAKNNLITDYKISASDFENKSLGVVTTLDLKLSRICKSVLEKEKIKGAVALIDVNNFDILALISCPDFDPSDVKSYLNSQDNNLFNRAVSCYDMGSIFKIIVACAALEKKAVKENDMYFCSGETYVSGKSFSCHKINGHGFVDISDAFSGSCNCAFIEIGHKVGYKNIIDMASCFGINKKIIYPTEFEQKKGTLPDEYNYYLADEANLSIGQGSLNGNVVHGAVISAVIANGGIIKNVNLINNISNEKGDNVENIRKDDEIRIISEKTAGTVYDMMLKTVKDGTGVDADIFKESCGGKTGTAQTGWFVDGENYQHAWFTGFFPADNPQYAMCVFVENGKSGSGVAAPLFGKIAKEIMKAE